jgi:Fe-S-cluster containining protein
MDSVSDTRFELPFKNPTIPEVLAPETPINFRCYKGISCFNACCKQADVTLAPYDILRLKRRLGMSSADFIREYTVPFQIDGDGLPGLKLKTDDTGTCLQLASDEGCGVYEDRPTVCRYYPVALLALREKGTAEAKEQYSLVREAHCKGHEEVRAIRIDAYRGEQGCTQYDERNRDWYQLILKKKSAGPAVGRPPMTSLRLFFMASYDLDNFRRFVVSDRFRATYRLPEGVYAELEQDDEALLAFAYRFLRQVLFGERTIEEAADAWEKRVEQRKAVWDARRQEEITRRQQAEDEKYAAAACGTEDCGDK